MKNRPEKEENDAVNGSAEVTINKLMALGMKPEAIVTVVLYKNGDYNLSTTVVGDDDAPEDDKVTSKCMHAAGDLLIERAHADGICRGGTKVSPRGRFSH